MNGQGYSIWKSRWLSVALATADTAGFALSWMGAYWLRVGATPLLGPINEPEPYLTVFPLMVAVGLANCAAFGLYVHRRRLSSLNRPSILLRASYHWLLYIVVVAFFFKELDLGRSVILFSGVLGLVYLSASRTVLRKAKGRALSRGRGTVRAAIVGSGGLAIEVKSFLQNHPETGFTLVGWVPCGSGSDDPQMRQRIAAEGIEVLGDWHDLPEITRREALEDIFLAIGDLEPEEQLGLLSTADIPGVSVHVVSNIFDVIVERGRVEEVSTIPVTTLRDGQMPLHQQILKRALDVACAVVGVVVWLLFFHWWIAIAIKRDSPGPVLFSQDRVGRNGRVFRLYKYRTMYADAGPYERAPLDETDPRVTRFGAWLRRTSLDELPQLLNVLRGDMSMVGPRPEMPFVVEQYEPWQRRRLDVKPGLTGLWQVIGRKNLPLHLNIQYDFYYIKNRSFLLDVEILFRTIPAVLKGRGAF